MPPSNWDHRPKERVRHVTPAPRRRPVIRIVLLMGLGLGLYFGFEPIASRWLSQWKPNSSKLVPKSNSLESRFKDLPSQKGTDDQGYRFFPNSDSSLWTLECKGLSNQACLDFLEMKRGRLALWVNKILGHHLIQGIADPPTFPWKAVWKQDLDSGLPEFELTSLIKLSLSIGKSTLNYSPAHTLQGWNLCPERGCPTESPIRLPTQTEAQWHADKATQTIHVLGPCTLIAPKGGWLAAIDTARGRFRLAIDHPGLDRTVFQGNLRVNSALLRGKFVPGGKSLATLASGVDSATITFYRNGSPELPTSWDISRAP